VIIGLHHAQITVPKGMEPQARAFYCDVLGLEEVEKPASLKGRGGLWVRCGDRQVHIGTENGFDRLTTKAHLGYEVTDVEHWRQRMKDAGIEPLQSVAIDGFERFEARDPFGNRIEFIQRTVTEDQ
jgi:catechol 2,3-dioxygenase-like lactoylglutathione lyase family enzyme